MKNMGTLYARPLLQITAIAPLLAACGGSTSGQAGAQLAAATTGLAPEARCHALAGSVIPPTSIGLPTKGASIDSATLVRASDSNNTNGEYCKARGRIWPVDARAENIEFEVALPSEWNGKSVHLGGGAFDGIVPDTTGFATSGFARGEAPGVQTPLAQGYVAFGSDGGRQGAITPAVTFQNDEVLANYAGAHIKKTRDVATYLMAKTYGKPAVRSYYVGRSGGGRQALYAAQRFPNDYDGIVSTFPASNLTGLFLQMGRISQASLAPGGFVTPAKGKVLAEAVLEHCDALDGVKDRLVSNPKACRFDPAVLRCPNGQDTGDSCFSDAQLNTLQVASTPLRMNFDLAHGIRNIPGYTYSEIANFFGKNFNTFGISAEQAVNESMLLPVSSPMYYFATNMTEYAIARDSTMTALRFNPADPGPLTARTQLVSAMWDSTSTDLSAFQQRGGKVLLQHGLSDEIVPSQLTVDYYNRLAERYGNAALGQFLKFYLVPGAGHSLNNQFGGAYDALSVLDNWVVNNSAPGELVITDVGTPTAGRTRPLCAYPQWPRYNGSGDVNSAASFTCVN